MRRARRRRASRAPPGRGAAPRTRAGARGAPASVFVPRGALAELRLDDEAVPFDVALAGGEAALDLDEARALAPAMPAHLDRARTHGLAVAHEDDVLALVALERRLLDH